MTVTDELLAAILDTYDKSTLRNTVARHGKLLVALNPGYKLSPVHLVLEVIHTAKCCKYKEPK